jgi:uncharacterized membrane protein YeiH
MFVKLLEVRMKIRVWHCWLLGFIIYCVMGFVLAGVDMNEAQGWFCVVVGFMTGVMGIICFGYEIEQDKSNFAEILWEKK